MSMNKWQCDYEGCKAVAIGVGEGINLRSIGWYFRIGGSLFCPYHRPDKTPCKDTLAEDFIGQPCGVCKGEGEAKVIADFIRTDDDKSDMLASKQRSAEWVNQMLHGRGLVI